MDQADSPPEPQLPRKGWHRIPQALAWIAAIIILLLLLLIAAIYALTKTESGTRTLLNNLSLLIPGQLSAELVSGSLDKGMALKNVSYIDGEKRIRIDHVAGKWSLFYNPLFLKVLYLKIGTVDATLPPSPSEEPISLPEQLVLPLAFDLQRISIENIVIHRDTGDATYKDILLQASSDKAHHAVQLRHADTPYGKASTDLKLNGISYEANGTASLAGSYGKQSFQLSADMSGTLRKLNIVAKADSGDAAGTAVVAATPFGKVPLQLAEIHINNLDPNSLNPEWPKARLSLNASLSPVGDAKDETKLLVQGPVSMTNALPGTIDMDLLPVASMQAQVKLDQTNRQLSQLNVRLNGGALLTGSGQLNDTGQGKFELRADKLDLHALHAALTPTRLDGPVTVKLADNTQFIDAALADPKISIHAKAELAPEQIVLQQAQLASGQAVLDVQGKLARGQESDYSISGKLRKFNPALFMSSAGRSSKKSSEKSYIERIQANINMDFQAQGSLKPELRAKLDFNIFDSAYASRPMTGGGHIHFSGLRVHSSDASLAVAGNLVFVKGSFGEPSDRLRFNINAPALARLGLGISGLLHADGELQGTVEQPRLNGQFRATNFKAGDIGVTALRGNVQLGGLPKTNPGARAGLNLAVSNFRSKDIRLNELNASIDGTYLNHSVRIEANGAMRTLRTNLLVTAQGKLQNAGQGLAWTGTVNRLENQGTPSVLLASPLSVDYVPGRLVLGAARLSIAKSIFELKHFRYSDKMVQSQGSFSKLDTAHLLATYREFADQPLPLASSLVLNGEWDVALSDTASGFIRIERAEGDASIVRGTREFPFGLRDLSFRADFKNSQVQFDARAEATRIGNVEAQGGVNINPGGDNFLEQDAPLSARVKAQIPRLQNLAMVAGPAVNLDGTMDADLTISGTVNEPLISGSIAADRLGVTVYDQGIRLRDGVARLRINNNILEVQKFELRGGDGFVRAAGRIPLNQSNQDLSADIVAENLLLLASPSRQLTLSGKATAAHVNQQLLVSGKFTVDRALFSLPEKRAPQLGDDVVVIRDSKSKPVAAKTQANAVSQPAGPHSPRVNIVVDLGNRFLFEGAGADLRLAGSIRIESEPGQTLQAFGTVRIAEGTYEAFGAELEIERGVFNFQGPLNNPNINILAMRRGQEVAAGVQVTGTIDQPRVQLVSEPNVSEEEKLSWLVFGRSGGGTDQGQAQAAAKGAALGLLNKLGGKQIGSKLGLDELSIGESEAGLSGQQVVNLGKEITDRLFIGFEQSLASAASVVKITYELKRHWSIVLRGGDVTGIAMSYNKRFNTLFRKKSVSAAEPPANPK